jgi:putative tricarboxylic transport membrane protein
MHRRHLLALAAVLAVPSSLALAVDNLQIIVPSEPGGGWDTTARALGDVMTANGIKGVSVENVPGNGGVIGLTQLVDQEKGRGDVLMLTGPLMIGSALVGNAQIDLEQTTPIARLAGEYLVVVVPANSPYRSLTDLAADLKRDASQVAIAGGAVGGVELILAGLIAKVAGGDVTRMNYVPFNDGKDAIAAVVGKYAAAGIGNFSHWAEMIAAGKVRALAISSPERAVGIDIPTLKEQGLEVVLANWRGVVAPPGIEAAAKQALLADVEAAVKSPQWQQVLNDSGWANLYLAGDDFAKQISDETAFAKEVLYSVGVIN